MKPVENVQRGLLEDCLERGRDGLVTRRQRLVGSPGRSEQLLELRRERLANDGLTVVPRHAHALGPVTEVREVEREAPIGAETEDAAQRIGAVRSSTVPQAPPLE